MSALPIAILASGEGTNLQALLDGPAAEGVVRIVGVASDRVDAPALGRAEAAGIPTGRFPASEYVDRAARDLALADWLEGQGAELIVSAGYMQLLDPLFIERFGERIINVHPSLLPRFPGMDAIGQALEAGASETGVTVHFVDEGTDTGPVIVQRAVPIRPGVEREELEREVHAVEHQLFPEAIGMVARGEVRIADHDPGQVIIERGG